MYFFRNLKVLYLMGFRYKKHFQIQFLIHSSSKIDHFSDSDPRHQTHMENPHLPHSFHLPQEHLVKVCHLEINPKWVSIVLCQIQWFKAWLCNTVNKLWDRCVQCLRIFNLFSAILSILVSFYLIFLKLALLMNLLKLIPWLKKLSL